MQKTIFTLALCCLSILLKAQIIKPIDLNGDGVKDKIQINEADNKLSINGKLVQFSGKLLKTNIVDLNINDNLKELELQILEASTDITESAFFTIDAKNNIISVGNIQSPKILGNGIVYGTRWYGYYAKSLKYILYNKHILEEVKIDMNFVGKEYKVQKVFNIHNEFAEKSSVIAQVAEKSTITIVANYKDEWLLIKTSNGILGWAKFNTVWQGECLENFSMAG